MLHAVCLSHARHVPGSAQPGDSSVDSSKQRALLGSTGMQVSSKQQGRSAAHKAVHAAQLGGGDAGLPPFVGADVPSGQAFRAEPLQTGPGVGAFTGGGRANWYNVAGLTANAVDLTVDVGTSLLAPVVNGVASNIPLMVPPGPDGLCLRGRPTFLPRVGMVMCVVGNASSVTNYMFRAANVLVDAAARGVGLAGQIAYVASGR